MAFDYKTTLAYFRNDYVPFEQANLSIGSSPVLYGLAVYSVFAANWNEEKQQTFLYRLQDHYERLQNSARMMDFTPLEQVVSYDQFVQIAKDMVTKNNIREDALIRVCLFIDEELAGTKIHGLKTSYSAYIY